jgi:murein DD-endopeptidase MepM/ murein hydrolase activator NlpD
MTQGWNENKACITSNGRVVGKRGGLCPPRTEPFYQSIGLKGHNGIDIATWRGEKVNHAGFYDGWMQIEKDFSGGIGVDVISHKKLGIREEYVPKSLRSSLEKEVTNKGVHYLTYVKCRYWHLKTPVGHDGKNIEYGQVVGLADNTGASSGDHLHFGVKWCDKNGRNTIDPFNGYYGAFNPMPFYQHHMFAKDAAGYLNIKPKSLTEQERREMLSHISVLQATLLSLREAYHKI